jgi:hypothetical protein
MLFAASEVLRIMSTIVRRADSGLAVVAARNAAHSMNAQQFRRLEEARTLRDLASIPTADLRTATLDPRPVVHS